MQKQLESTAKKLSGHADARKAVLLDFYGNKLHEDDIPPLLALVVIPSLIDEVWMTVKDWISHDEYKIGYERFFVRS